MSQSVSAQQRAIAGAMPVKTKQQSKIQRLRRLLDNTKLTATDVYQPIVRQALTGLKGQRVHLLLDRVVLTETQNVLVISLGFRRRSLPLVWHILPHQGSSHLTDQQKLLRAAAKLLPAGVRITVHADSEFRSQLLFAWLRRRRWNAILGIRGNVQVTVDPTQAGQPLTDWLPHRESVAYLNQVWLTEERCGPRNILAWWDKNDRGVLTCYDQFGGDLANLSDRQSPDVDRDDVPGLAKRWVRLGQDRHQQPQAVCAVDHLGVSSVPVVREHRTLAGQTWLSDAAGCWGVTGLATELVYAGGELAESRAHL
jgi:hypothetical protein